MVKTQGVFLENLEKSVVAFREKLRINFVRVLEAIDGNQGRSSLRLDSFSDDESSD
jgi:hypothetical protein